MTMTDQAGAPDAPARILCTLDNASDCISGVRFVALDDGRRCSEAVAPDVAARFCRVPGYLLAPADLDVEAVDAALAARPVGDAPSDVAALQVTIGELERANLAMAADVAQERQQRMAAEQKLSKTEVPKLEAEIARLKHQVDEPSSVLTTLQTENATLRAANERLTAEVAGLRATAVAPPPRAPATGLPPPRRPVAPAAPTPPA